MRAFSRWIEASRTKRVSAVGVGDGFAEGVTVADPEGLGEFIADEGFGSHAESRPRTTTQTRLHRSLCTYLRTYQPTMCFNAFASPERKIRSARRLT